MKFSVCRQIQQENFLNMQLKDRAVREVPRHKASVEEEKTQVLVVVTQSLTSKLLWITWQRYMPEIPMI